MSQFLSRGIVHHVDSTVTCPDCGRRFRTGTVIAEGPDTTRAGERMVVVSFRSKQPAYSEQWGQIRVPVPAVRWTQQRVQAWDTKDTWTTDG
jgi:hypothetical protein